MNLNFPFFGKLPFAILLMASLFGCGSSNNGGDDDPGTSVPVDTTKKDTVVVTDSFAKGADVSWLTQMEAEGYKFYSQSGKQTECMALLKSMGTNAIRLRVWVNPTGGYCNKQDVLAKAERAQALGMKLMIDFHYSDTWADPGSQTVPAQWKNYNLQQLDSAVASHTEDVLGALKQKNIDVEWVQVGNETVSGMLWPLGQATGNKFSGFASLVKSGYAAVKQIYPKAKVIIHLDKGQELNHYTWMFDGLKAAGAKWDVIGMSLYPDDSNWQSYATQCLSNITTLYKRYNTPCMICEVGMSWDSSKASSLMSTLIINGKQNKACLGLFYWEPECYNNFQRYSKGAFDSTGKPTSALLTYSIY